MALTVMEPIVLAALLSVPIGLTLGMLGGGGAILTLPMLVYVARVDPRAAIALSLFVVATTSIVSSVVQARRRTVRWSLGLRFGLAAMAGAFLGARVAHFVPPTVLLVLFAIVMIVAAIAMMRERPGPSERTGVRWPLALALGAGVGVLSGLVGAGGGFLIVPALVLFGGLEMRAAVGTSLFVIALQSVAGLMGHIGHVSIDWTLAITVAIAATGGSVLGAAFAPKVPAELLRRGFAWLVASMGVFVLAKEVSAPLATAVGIATLWAITSIRQRALASPRPS